MLSLILHYKQKIKNMPPVGFDFFHIAYYATPMTIVTTTIKIQAENMSQAIELFKQQYNTEPVSCISSTYLSKGR